MDNKDTKQLLLWMKIQAVLLSLLLVVALAGGLYLFGATRNLAKATRAIEPEQFASIMDSIDHISDTLDEIDAEELKAAVESLGKAADTFSKLDTDSLNTAIGKLAQAAEKIEALSTNTDDLAATLEALQNAANTLGKFNIFG